MQVSREGGQMADSEVWKRRRGKKDGGRERRRGKEGGIRIDEST